MAPATAASSPAPPRNQITQLSPVSSLAGVAVSVSVALASAEGVPVVFEVALVFELALVFEVTLVVALEVAVVFEVAEVVTVELGVAAKAVTAKGPTIIAVTIANAANSRRNTRTMGQSLPIQTNQNAQHWPTETDQQNQTSLVRPKTADMPVG
jgi:hypothetical protein